MKVNFKIMVIPRRIPRTGDGRPARAGCVPGRVRALAAAALLVVAAGARAQEGRFLTEAQAPAAVFPDAQRFEPATVEATPVLREQVARALGGRLPSHWEDQWLVVRAFRGDALLGRAVVVEEIGKHRLITFVVGVRPDGTVADVAVMAYREAYGGEVRSSRFLRQFRGRALTDPLRPYDDLTNVAGATLSVEAAGRAVRKALAIASVLPAGDE
jgi:H+/Na+-translocating ferredoxin:NAD+ oxidoreductase subunit G